MRYIIEKKAFVFGESYEIKNDSEEVIYVSSGSFIKEPYRVVIMDTLGEVVVTIDTITTNGRLQFDIKTNNEAIRLTEHSFSLHTIDEMKWRLQGRFLRHIYEYICGDRLHMNFRKQWFTWGSRYKLDVTHKEDTVLAIGILIAVKRNKFQYIIQHILENL